jgi:HSP20 family protein
MYIHRSNAWPSANQFPRDFNRAISRLFNVDVGDQSDVVTSQWAPHVDIREEGKRFVIAADIPGVDPKDIEINMDKGVLSIKGERKAESIAEGDEYTRVETARGVFHRRFALPDSANPDGITATGKHGVLEISIPKRTETTPRKIDIQTGE